MHEYRFHLAIPAEEYLAYYEGVMRAVVVSLASGQRLQFPAESLRPFVSREGVYGEFVMRVDGQNRLQGIERVMRK
ncbi:MAG: DUF2835 domain-containing protein [Gammaproteobacteria bacterium]|nr:DUF2835 domain-containing protein [Gammaproteobacteria bacterium]